MGNKPMAKMLGSIHAMKFGVGIAAAAITLAGSSVWSLAETGAVHLHVAKPGFLSAPGAAQGPKPIKAEHIS